MKILPQKTNRYVNVGGKNYKVFSYQAIGCPSASEAVSVEGKRYDVKKIVKYIDAYSEKVSDVVEINGKQYPVKTANIFKRIFNKRNLHIFFSLK